MIFLNKKGFTLIELIITIIISALIMVGLFNFIVKINEIMVVSQNKSSIYSNLTDFIENYQNKKNTYSS
jgi:prepilin-type N-terminal cleavage/methylation domain-containing protein